MIVRHDRDELSPQELEAVLRTLANAGGELAARMTRKFDVFFPDDGPLSREHYPKHMEFFAAGADFGERLFMAANRIGKSEAGAFEVTCHATGEYPHWWTGKRFDHPVDIWVCGTTNETTRDIVQTKLLGAWDDPEKRGGMIPSHLILGTVPRPHGLRGSVETCTVKHKSGGKSRIGFKTYEQGRKSFEGTEKHVIWNDEEPPGDVYQEQLLRLMTVQGIMLVTFTPLQGMSEVVTGFVEASEEQQAYKIYIQAGWDDVPHLSEDEKRRQLATMLPYQLAARTKGEPSLGAGAIYPLLEDDIKVPARMFPWTWPRSYGMDVGWNRTAAIFGTMDVGSGIYYLYDEHYVGGAEPPSHAMGIRARGEFLIGAIDPASRGRSQKDGTQLLQSYQQLGLNLVQADNGVETGLLDTWTLLISGRLKVCENCVNWFREWRKYHRDEKGNIVKTNDHLMDATRYWVRTGRDHMKVRPRTASDRPRETPTRTGGTWMGA